MLIDLPEPVNHTLKQGDRWHRILLVRDSGGNPVNLAGYGVELNVSRARRRPPTWTWRNAPGIARITNRDTGEVEVGLPPDATREFAQLESVAYDLVLYRPDSTDRYSLMDGVLRIRQETANGH